MNDQERAMWVENDEGLYLWRKSERMALTPFVKKHRAELDKIIEEKLR